MAILSSTWSALWGDCYAAARRPLPGICLPPEESTSVARDVFRKMLEMETAGAPLPRLVEFLRIYARKFSLSAVAQTRRELNQPGLWTELKEGGSPPPVLMQQLQQNEPATQAWTQTVANFRQRCWNTVKCQGVPLEDIDDVLSETLMALFKPRADGVTRPLDTLLVYEELMPLLNAIARNVATDFVRSRSAQKRTPKEGGPVGGEMLDNVAGTDPVPGEAYTFLQCYDDCRDCLSDFQWDVLLRLYVLESVNRLQLIEEPALLKNLALKASSSSATRRRRLNEFLDTTIDTLASRIRLP